MKLAVFVILIFIQLPWEGFSKSLATTYETKIEFRKEKRNSIRRLKQKIKTTKGKNSVYENTTAVFVIGMLLSISSVLLLFGSGGIGLSILFGFFGGLICLLTWKPDEDVHLPVLGVIFGIIGFVGGFIRYYSLRD